MVQSNAENVDAYLAEVSDLRKPALTRLRELCRAELTGFDEVMAYGMPAYGRAVANRPAGRRRGDRLRQSEAVHLLLPDARRRPGHVR